MNSTVKIMLTSLMLLFLFVCASVSVVRSTGALSCAVYSSEDKEIVGSISSQGLCYMNAGTSMLSNVALAVNKNQNTTILYVLASMQKQILCVTNLCVL